MNERKDIKEGLAFMLKRNGLNKEIKPNYAKIAREHGCDWRTVKNTILAMVLHLQRRIFNQFLLN